MRLILFGCLGLFATFARAQGPISGFLTPKGETVVALSYATEQYDRYFLAEGEENRELTINSYNLFLEVGTGPNMSIVATLPYLETGTDNRGLQDASIWIKYLNSRKEKENSAQNVFTAIGLTFPVGNYETDTPSAIGNKSTVFNGRVVYQYRHNSGFFVNAISGLDFQMSPESQAAWPLLLRSGYGGKYFFLEGWFEMIRSLEVGNINRSAVGGTGSSWNRLGLTLFVPVTKWFGLNAGGAWITGGKFIGASSRYNIGGVLKISRPRK